MGSDYGRDPSGRRREVGNVGRGVVETFLAGLNASGSSTATPEFAKLIGSQPVTVFGEPVTAGSYTVITAAEVETGGKVEFGSGITQPRRLLAQAVARGLGGGETTRGRPVAVIVMGPSGVEVRPVFDLSRVALAGLAASTAIGMAGFATWWAVARAEAGRLRLGRR